jgi:hypothetical protein
MSGQAESMPDVSTGAETLIARDFYRPDEAAKVLETKRRTLSRWEANGVGPPITRLGHRVLYRKASLLEWLNSQELKPGKKRSAKRTGKPRRRSAAR